MRIRPALASALALAALPFAVSLAAWGGGLVGLPAESPPVSGDSDVYEQAWHFWWVGTSIRSGTDPRTCPLIGLPAPGSLVGQNIGWPDAALFGTLLPERPGEALFLALLTGTILTAASGFLFARSWGLDAAESLLAAMLITWAPARVAHLLQHYTIACIWPVILALACLRYYLKGRSPLLLAAASLSLLAASLESAYHLLSGVLGSALIIAAQARASTPGRTAASSAGVLLAASSAGLFYLSFPGSLPGGAGPGQALYWSAEPASYLLPSPFGTLGAVAGLDGRAPWMPNIFDGVVTPGFFAILMAALALLGRGSRDLPGWRGSCLVPFLLSIVPFLLSLGPRLKILGAPTCLPLPYAIALGLPVLEGARSASRFAILGSVFLAVPAARFARSIGRSAATVIVTMAALELVPPGLPSVDPAIPSVYSSGLEGSVLEIPASDAIRRYAYFMTEDGCSRIVFFHARRAAGLPAAVDPFLAGSGARVTEEEALETGADLIIYNRWLYGPEERADLDMLYSGLFEYAPVSDTVWVWRR